MPCGERQRPRAADRPCQRGLPRSRTKRAKWQIPCSVLASQLSHAPRHRDHARARISEKRGGGEQPITLDEVRDGSQPVEESNGVDVLELHEALEKLATLDPEQARVVELRYFSGLTIEETAEALGISAATVKREWAFARAWLQRELRRMRLDRSR